MTSIELHCRLKLSLQPILRNDADIVYLEVQAFQLEMGPLRFLLMALHCIATSVNFTSVIFEIRVSIFFVYIKAFIHKFSPLHQIIDKVLKQNIIWS